MIDQLETLLAQGELIENEANLIRWRLRVIAFLRTAFGVDQATEFENLENDNNWDRNALELGHLQGLIAKLGAGRQESSAALSSSALIQSAPGLSATKVFVVHGHDNDAKEKVARFLERIGLTTIILHEQPNSGRTVIEKFETYSDDIAFAVVLLTPDDIGGVASSPGELKPRARQNVIMELGYFLGRLGRMRVCALHKGGTELPSDYQGVVYIDLDSAGTWKTKLAQEFVQAKLPIDLSGLLGG